MLKKLSFSIQETPVLYNSYGDVLTSETHKVIMKDDGYPLSVMKSTYCPMMTEDFMETTERMSQISGFEISGYSEFNNGRIVLSHLKNTLEDFKINGHKIDDYLVTGTSYDGSYSFFVGTSTVLLRCQNQFSHLSQSMKIRNTKSSPMRRDHLMSDLQKYFINRKNMYEYFNRMIDVKVDPKLREQVIDYVLNVDKEDRLGDTVSTRKLNQMEELRTAILTEEKELGNNLWATFNGVTRYTTHSLHKKEEIFGNMFNTAGLLNNKAYKFAMDLISQ